MKAYQGLASVALALAALGAQAQPAENPAPAGAQAPTCKSLFNNRELKPFFPKTGVGFIQEGYRGCKVLIGPDGKTHLPGGPDRDLSIASVALTFTIEIDRAKRDEKAAVTAELREQGRDRSGRLRGRDSMQPK